MIVLPTTVIADVLINRSLLMEIASAPAALGRLSYPGDRIRGSVFLGIFALRHCAIGAVVQLTMTP